MKMSDTPTGKTENQVYGSKGPTAETVTSDGEVPVSVLEDGSLDPVYEAKAKVLNKAIQDIGMGKYQWQVSSPLHLSLRQTLRLLTNTALVTAPPISCIFMRYTNTCTSSSS